MTDDKDGGSSSDSSDPKGDKKGDVKNPTVKITMDEALAQLEDSKRVMGEKDQLIVDLTTQLKEANDVLEGQEKAKLIGEILPRSSFSMDVLVSKTIEDLKNIRATLDQARLPKVNSVRFGVSAADVSDREKGLTVGDLSWATAQKRKAQAGVA
jgi:hypothetical protein